MRSKFDSQLARLNKELIKMGALCEQVIDMAAKSLADGDAGLAERIIPLDSEIDQMERSIESLCLKMLLQQQPVARDLRQISAALKMITDMERIGDQAADIAEILGFIRDYEGRAREDIGKMARAAIDMVTKSIDAYVNDDLALAESVIALDDTVDEYFSKVKSELIGLISEKPEDGEYAVDLLMIAKYFERIGDHAENIAQWVEFSVTGVHKGVEEP